MAQRARDRFDDFRLDLFAQERNFDLNVAFDDKTGIGTATVKGCGTGHLCWLTDDIHRNVGGTVARGIRAAP